ncbi:MAG TPA: hypothetical protein VFX72_01660 [Usitatibacteraceae bacterium]|nr:hypothetical protein [Usitatibacteraceae bacterium]
MKGARILVASAGLVAALGPGAAQAQQASDQVKQACRQTANSVAGLIQNAKQRGVKDLEAGITKPSGDWPSQVAAYMIQAANRSDSLSQGELASLGYAYCVERRPRG